MKMNLLRKALVLLAGIAVLVLVMSVAVPRAVHAVAAALVRDVDNAARHPFASTCTATTNSFTISCSVTTPVGEEVVIQNETLLSLTDPNNTTVSLVIQAPSAGALVEASVFGTDDGSGQPNYSASHGTGTVNMYIDPGTTITCFAVTPHPNPGPIGMSFTCFLSGYYVTLP